MPKIKDPISPEEIRYNTRYDPAEQKRMFNEIKLKGEGFDGYDMDFIYSIGIKFSYSMPLTESQADHLVRLYNRV